MEPGELKTYLYAHIPLSQAMAVDVIRADAGAVILAAPLGPNINHRATVFGGSAAALAILAAWALLYVRLQQDNIRSRVVIQRNSMEYLQPIPDSFEASAIQPDTERWQRFVQMLQRKRRARISMAVEVVCRGEKVGEMTGEFVAFLQNA